MIQRHVITCIICAGVIQGWWCLCPLENRFVCSRCWGVSRSVERHVSERPFCVALLHQFRAVMAQPVAQFEVTVALSSVHHPSDSYSQAQVRSEVQ